MPDDHSHAIVDGVLLRVSASQIQKYDDTTPTGCNRRWWFNKKLHLEDGAGKRGDQGTESHKRLEIFERTGEDVLTPHEREAKRFLLPPLPQIDPRAHKLLLFEQEISDLDIKLAGVKLTGKIDVASALPYWIDNEGLKHGMHEGTIEIHDHKTTTNIKWAKSAPELATNVQMLLYGWAGHKLFPNTDSVRLSHGVIVVPPGGRQAKKVSTVISLDQIQRELVRVELLVDGMVRDAAKDDAQQVKPNFNACQAYHKTCPFYEMCVTDPVERLIGLTVGKNEGTKVLAFQNTTNNGDPKMSLLKNSATPKVTEAVAAAPVKSSSLLQRKPAAPAPVAAPEPTVGVTPPDAPASDPVLAVPGTEGQMHEDSNKQLHIFKKGAWALAGAMTRALYDAQAQASVTEGGSVVSKPESKVIVINVPEPVQTFDMTVETDADKATPEAPVGSGRGRPSAAEQAAAAAKGLTVKEYRAQLSGHVTTPSAPKPATATAKAATGVITPAVASPTSAAQPKATAASGQSVTGEADGNARPAAEVLNLYINCIPRTPCQPIEQYIDGLAAELAANPKVGCDIRCSTHEALDFGKWKGALAMAIKRNPPKPGNYTCLSRGDLYLAGADAVAELASEVVRGCV